VVWFLYYEAVSKVSDFMNEPTVVFDDVNPKPGLQGEIWMLVVVFEFGYPDVPGVYVEVDDE